MDTGQRECDRPTTRLINHALVLIARQKRLRAAAGFQRDRWLRNARAARWFQQNPKNVDLRLDISAAHFWLHRSAEELSLFPPMPESTSCKDGSSRPRRCRSVLRARPSRRGRARPRCRQARSATRCCERPARQRRHHVSTSGCRRRDRGRRNSARWSRAPRKTHRPVPPFSRQAT